MTETAALYANQIDPQTQARLLRAALMRSSGAAGGDGSPSGFPAALAMQLAMKDLGGLSSLSSQLAGGLGAGMGRVVSGSKAVPRISQTDPAEYETAAQAKTWGPVSCSATALTASLRSFGSTARVSDVLRAMPGAVSIDLGLVSRSALVNAAGRFGVSAREDISDYAGLQQATGLGQPVLADVVDRRFPEGHWLVVTGADASGVKLVDSSGYDLKSMSKEEFMSCWQGRAIRLQGPGSDPDGVRS